MNKQLLLVLTFISLLWGVKPALAQLTETQNVSVKVYERLPDFPRENQYLNVETGEVAVNNTLISRLIRYHVYVKNRPPFYQLDWKLTLADYLGANERIAEDLYPGYSTLQTNPIARDIEVIGSLNRAQRQELVEVLVSIFNPNATKIPTVKPDEQQPTPSTPSTPILPKPGDAQLLLP